MLVWRPCCCKLGMMINNNTAKRFHGGQDRTLGLLGDSVEEIMRVGLLLSAQEVQLDTVLRWHS